MLKVLPRWSTLILVFPLCIALIFAASYAPAAHASIGGFTFTNFELSKITGTTCPGSSNCSNTESEPQIRADRSGNFYGSSENGLGGGTVAYKSSDGGKHYTTLVSPNAGSASNNSGFAPGGGDTDLATAPVKNSSGFYNVYVASLSLANVDVSASMDGGKTFVLNPIGATISGDDREWIAADGSSKVCISYHDVTTDNIDVDCSYNAGLAFTQLGDAFDTSHLFLLQNNEIGNLMIDPNNHYIYQTFSGIANAGEVSCSQAGTCGYHVVYMAVSTDGGKTFTDHVVYNNPNTTVSYGHQFVNMSIDRAGNLYSVYSDNHNVYYSFSTNHGTSWSAPSKVNAPNWGANTAIEPWSVANGTGHLDIVWYGTAYYSSTTPPDNYPMSAAWHADFAQNLHATTPGSSFNQVAATPVIHYGGVCESGVGCTGNRDLYDDFGVAVNPNTGYASIIYSDDQYMNTSSNPPQSGCTAATTNTASCDHTSIATQTYGTGI
jgi:hypothetical protein